MDFFLNIKLRSLAKRYNAEYITLRSDRIFLKEYRKLERQFHDFVRARRLKTNDIRRRIASVYRQSRSSDELIRNLYDVEYDSGQEKYYGYIAPILTPRGFALIAGSDFLQKNDSKTILDVGAGSNEFLRFCHQTLGFSRVNLYGIDPSNESMKTVVVDGFHGYQGVLRNAPFSAHSFDLICLSYFIDYDTDQSGTFAAARELVKIGGYIVLEGWFPVHQFGLLESDRDSFEYITKGRSASEDIELVIRALGANAPNDSSITCKRILRGYRVINSHYGLNTLPSFYLVFRYLP